MAQLEQAMTRGRIRRPVSITRDTPIERATPNNIWLSRLLSSSTPADSVDFDGPSEGYLWYLEHICFEKTITTAGAVFCRFEASIFPTTEQSSLAFRIFCKTVQSIDTLDRALGTEMNFDSPLLWRPGESLRMLATYQHSAPTNTFSSIFRAQIQEIQDSN